MRSEFESILPKCLGNFDDNRKRVDIQSYRRTQELDDIEVAILRLILGDERTKLANARQESLLRDVLHLSSIDQHDHEALVGTGKN